MLSVKWVGTWPPTHLKEWKSERSGSRRGIWWMCSGGISPVGGTCASWRAPVKVKAGCPRPSSTRPRKILRAPERAETAMTPRVR